MKKQLKRRFKLLTSAVKIISAQILAAVCSPVLSKKNIWIFSEKKTEARDNGYHFFKYIREKHPEIAAYYVITKNSAERNKVEKLGRVINYDSFRHCLYYFAAKERVCSQIHGVRPFEELSGLTRLYFYRRKDQRQINLKHGISKDFRPDAFDFRKVGFDLYVSGAKPEYEYIKKTFSYPDKNIVLSGFCRFDALQHAGGTEKIILIMPTFRSWLRTSDSSKDRASDAEAMKFCESEYFRVYRDLLNDRRLRDLCREFDYRVVFYLHYTFQPYRFLFEESTEKDDRIVIAGRKDYDVQDLLLRSSVLVTDYSSVFFDYAYMHKPVVYYQFDKAEYREKHYQEGFFVYERDGFGPVLSKGDEVLAYLDMVLRDGCRMQEIYLARAESFFQPYDDHNCDRVYDAILRLDQ